MRKIVFFLGLSLSIFLNVGCLNGQVIHGKYSAKDSFESNGGKIHYTCSLDIQRNGFVYDYKNADLHITPYHLTGLWKREGKKLTLEGIGTSDEKRTVVFEIKKGRLRLINELDGANKPVKTPKFFCPVLLRMPNK